MAIDNELRKILLREQDLRFVTDTLSEYLGKKDEERKYYAEEARQERLKKEELAQNLEIAKIKEENKSTTKSQITQVNFIKDTTINGRKYKAGDVGTFKIDNAINLQNKGHVNIGSLDNVDDEGYKLRLKKYTDTKKKILTDLGLSFEEISGDPFSVMTRLRDKAKKADLNLNDDEIIKQYIFAGNEEEYNQFKGYEKEFGDLFKSPEETNISKKTDFEW